MTELRAVVFDWRGTLVTTLGEETWVRTALRSLGRDSRAETVAQVRSAIVDADGHSGRLDAPDIDADRDRHRDAYYAVFGDAGIDGELADALYTVESDPSHNRFATDVAATVAGLAERGCKICVLSDIHFDIRPAFAAQGLEPLIDSFVLSYEQGVQKPDPAIFRAALEQLGTGAEETLMLGDRPSHDGAAVSVGMPVLLVPPLNHVNERRLHHVDALISMSHPTQGC